MWRKHHSVFQDHIKYIRHDIVKPFRVRINCYAKCVQEMHDPEKYLPPPLMKSESFDKAIWKVYNKEFSEHKIRVDIKEGLPSSMQYEFEDNQEDHFSLTHELFCDLMSTIKVKD